MEYINKIYNMDCIAGMSLLPDNSVDMVLTDLPYGITGCRWDSLIPFDLLWEQLDRVVKPNGAMVFTASQPFTTELINSNRKDFKYTWYWLKNQVTGFPFAKYQPLRCVEDIAVFYRKTPVYTPQGLIELQKPVKTKASKCKEDYVYDNRGTLNKEYVTHFTNYPRQTLSFKCQREGLHPTQKPVELFEYLIKTYTYMDYTTCLKYVGNDLDTAVANMMFSTNESKHILTSTDDRYEIWQLAGEPYTYFLHYYGIVDRQTGRRYFLDQLFPRYENTEGYSDNVYINNKNQLCGTYGSSLLVCDLKDGSVEKHLDQGGETYRKYIYRSAYDKITSTTALLTYNYTEENAVEDKWNLNIETYDENYKLIKTIKTDVPVYQYFYTVNGPEVLFEKGQIKLFSKENSQEVFKSEL